MVTRIAGLTPVLVAAHLACADAFKIEAMEHDIQQITQSNFDGVIGKFRDSSISSLWLFKDDDKEDKKFLSEYNAVAKDLKGMAKITAINCNDWPIFCKKNEVKTTPKIMIYPMNPQPAFAYEGKMEAKVIAGRISKLFINMGTLLTAENLDTFLTTDPTKPKVVLASSKKSPPTIFKALTTETVFRRTVKFGFASESDTEVIQKLKVKKFPTLLLQRGQKSEIKETYKGEMNFLAIKDWVNLHSESGMGDKSHSAAGVEETVEEAKPWLVQEVPELTQKSHQDICFKGDGLCVIYLKDGEVTTEEVDMLTGLSKKFTSQLSGRGTKTKWMWMNLKLEDKFRELFEPAMLPSAVVFNPVKRLRFTKLDHGEDNEIPGNKQTISDLMDKVLGGDARFKQVPGQKLPAWAPRETPQKAKKAEL